MDVGGGGEFDGGRADGGRGIIDQERERGSGCGTGRPGCVGDLLAAEEADCSCEGDEGNCGGFWRGVSKIWDLMVG